MEWSWAAEVWWGQACWAFCSLFWFFTSLIWTGLSLLIKTWPGCLTEDKAGGCLENTWHLSTKADEEMGWKGGKGSNSRMSSYPQKCSSQPCFDVLYVLSRHVGQQICCKVLLSVLAFAVFWFWLSWHIAVPPRGVTKLTCTLWIGNLSSYCAFPEIWPDWFSWVQFL